MKPLRPTAAVGGFPYPGRTMAQVEAERLARALMLFASGKKIQPRKD